MSHPNRQPRSRFSSSVPPAPLIRSQIRPGCKPEPQTTSKPQPHDSDGDVTEFKLAATRGGPSIKFAHQYSMPVSYRIDMGLQVSADSDSDRPEAGRRSLAAGGCSGPGPVVGPGCPSDSGWQTPGNAGAPEHQSLSKYGGRAERHTRGGQAER
jgi:hypothetical protein